MTRPVGAAAPVENVSAQPLKKDDLAGAARQFESLLITQILRSARESGGSEGWMGSSGDSGSATAVEMAEEQFAAALAARGGFGLASMVTRDLQKAPQTSAQPSPKE